MILEQFVNDLNKSVKQNFMKIADLFIHKNRDLLQRF